MSVIDYLEAIKQTRTYQLKMVQPEPYTYKSRWWGMHHFLPPDPWPTAKHALLLFDPRNPQTPLQELSPYSATKVELTSHDVDQVILLYVCKMAKSLPQESPSTTYQLSDQAELVVDIECLVQVTNAQCFWQNAPDPIGAVESAVHQKAQIFFERLAMSDFLPPRTTQTKTSGANDARFAATKYEISLKQAINQLLINGLALQCQQVTIHQPTDKRWIDLFLAHDTTFAPYSLREVIDVLDPELYEEFYKSNYHEALAALHVRVSEEREAYQQQLGENLSLLQDAARLLFAHGASVALKQENDRYIVNSIIDNNRMNQGRIGNNHLAANQTFIKILMNAQGR